MVALFLRRLLVVFFVAGAMMVAPAQALPEFARIYGLPCTACHTVAPQLNDSGRAFQANFFRWTSKSGAELPRKTGLAALPFSGLATGDMVRLASQHRSEPFRFETLQLYAADQLPLNSFRNGGFFIKGVVAIREGKAGDLAQAWVALPIAGNNGQLAATVGQFSPLQFQYDPLNSLTVSLPVGLSQGTDGVAFTNPTAGIRIDYFNNRGTGTANGNYLTVGALAKDRLTLNNTAHLNGKRGVFVHGFRRSGESSLGAFAYSNGGHRQLGVLATDDVTPNLHFLAAASEAREVFGSTVFHLRGFSLEANGFVARKIGLTGRIESTSGFVSETYPVVGVTIVPFHPDLLRLSLETVQQKSNRQVALTTYLQF